jgi:clan AA aspartic protease
MIRGHVNALHEAIIPLRLRGPTGKELVIDAIIDTGFTGKLTLPQSVIQSLELINPIAGEAALADGTIRHYDVFEADLLWDGHWKRVAISELGDEVLAGMKLLVGYELRIALRVGGAVELISLP